MTKKIHYPLIILGLLLTILALLILLVKTPVFQQNPAELSRAITLDLLITIPIFYFLLIRKKGIPKISVVTVFMACAAIASFVLPIEHQFLLTQIKTFGIPFVELGVLTFVAFKTREVIHSFRQEGNAQLDFYDALSLACSKVLPGSFGKILVTEIAVLYYTFTRSPKKEVKDHEYTYFKRSGIKSVVYALMFILLIETGAVHMIIHEWSPMVAFISSFLSVYMCLQFYALSRSMDRRLFSIDFENQILHLKYGFFNQTTLPIAHIKSIELNRRTLPEDGSIVKFSALGGFDSHNIIIHLDQEHTLYRIYGIEKQFQALAIYVDEKDKFVKAIKDQIAN